METSIEKRVKDSFARQTVMATTQSLSLELRAEMQPPPRDMREWAKRWVADQKLAKEVNAWARKADDQ